MNVAMPKALAGVQPQDVRAMWPYLRPWFELIEKTSKGRERAEGLIRQVETGDVQCWIWWPSPEEIKAVCITEILLHPGVKVCRIRACVGRDRSEWLADAVPVIKAWAKEQGCDEVEPFARVGWERDLKALGFRKQHIVMSCRI